MFVVLGLRSKIGFFRVGVFIWRGSGPVVWGLLGFLGWGSLYKHIRITLGKNGVFGIMSEVFSFAFYFIQF